MIVNSQQEFVDQLKTWMRIDVQSVHVVAGTQADLAEQLVWRAYRETRTKANGPTPDGLNLVTWDVLNGLRAWEAGETVRVRATDQSSRNFVRAVQLVTASGDDTGEKVLGDDALVVFRDPHFELCNNPASLSAVKEAIKANEFGTKHLTTGKKSSVQKRTVVWLTNGPTLSPELVGYVKTLTVPLPVAPEIDAVIDRLTAAWPDEAKRLMAAGTDTRRQARDALAGLGSRQIADVLSESVLEVDRDVKANRPPDLRATVEKNKADALRASETLTYESPAAIAAAPDLKGYDQLDEWVSHRRVVYTPAADGLNLDMPKGLALVGIPGTGKSTAARRVARGFGLPLVRFDFSAVFGSLVGESERRMRESLQTVTAIRGCVLLVDEVDKALGGAGESSGDSGVTQRVFGNLLTWMADKNDRTFVLFTMNRIDKLPPELLRRGRVDEVFFVDLPAEPVRREILALHMARRQVNPESFSADEWDGLVESTDQFVGAELEEVVKSARLLALATDPASRAMPTMAQLIETARRMVPLAKTDADNIASIRSFGAGRAVSVTGDRGRKVKAGRSRRTEAVAARDITLHVDPTHS